jgi:hypothetical protein
METYIKLGALVYKHRSCKGIFAQRMLAPNAIQSMRADLFDLPDDTRIDSFPNASNQKIKLLVGEVTNNDCEQSLQTISPILNSEGTDAQCINQKAPLMSGQNKLSPDWVTGLEGETVICGDVTVRLNTSLPILEGSLNVTCVQCENGKHISPFDSAQPTMTHGADTESLLQTRISHVHPTAIIHQRCTLLRGCYSGVLLVRAGALPAMLWRTRVLVTRSEATIMMERWMEAGRLGDRGGACRRRSGPNRRRAGAGGPGADPGRRRLSGVLAEHSLIG